MGEKSAEAHIIVLVLVLEALTSVLEPMTDLCYCNTVVR